MLSINSIVKKPSATGTADLIRIANAGVYSTRFGSHSPDVFQPSMHTPPQKADRTYQACDAAFVYTRTPALIPPISARDYFIKTLPHRFPKLDDDSGAAGEAGARPTGIAQT